MCKGAMLLAQKKNYYEIHKKHHNPLCNGHNSHMEKVEYVIHNIYCKSFFKYSCSTKTEITRFETLYALSSKYEIICFWFIIYCFITLIKYNVFKVEI